MATNKVFGLLGKYGYINPLVTAATAAHDNSISGPCGRLLFDNIHNEWRHSFRMHPEVLPLQHNGLSSTDTLAQAVKQHSSPLQGPLLAAMRTMVAKPPFGFLRSTNHLSSTAQTQSGRSPQLFSGLAHPVYWTQLQFSYCVLSCKLSDWMAYWQRQRLTWWKRVGSKNVCRLVPQ